MTSELTAGKMARVHPRCLCAPLVQFKLMPPAGCCAQKESGFTMQPRIAHEKHKRLHCVIIIIIGISVTVTVTNRERFALAKRHKRQRGMQADQPNQEKGGESLDEDEDAMEISSEGSSAVKGAPLVTLVGAGGVSMATRYVIPDDATTDKPSSAPAAGAAQGEASGTGSRNGDESGSVSCVTGSGEGKKREQEKARVENPSNLFVFLKGYSGDVYQLELLPCLARSFLIKQRHEHWDHDKSLHLYVPASRRDLDRIADYLQGDRATPQRIRQRLRDYLLLGYEQEQLEQRALDQRRLQLIEVVRQSAIVPSVCSCLHHQMTRLPTELKPGEESPLSASIFTLSSSSPGSASLASSSSSSASSSLSLGIVPSLGLKPSRSIYRYSPIEYQCYTPEEQQLLDEVLIDEFEQQLNECDILGTIEVVCQPVSIGAAAAAGASSSSSSGAYGLPSYLRAPAVVVKAMSDGEVEDDDDDDDDGDGTNKSDDSSDNDSDGDGDGSKKSQRRGRHRSRHHHCRRYSKSKTPAASAGTSRRGGGGRKKRDPNFNKSRGAIGSFR